MSLEWRETLFRTPLGHRWLGHHLFKRLEARLIRRKIRHQTSSTNLSSARENTLHTYIDSSSSSIIRSCRYLQYQRYRTTRICIQKATRKIPYPLPKRFRVPTTMSTIYRMRQSSSVRSVDMDNSSQVRAIDALVPDYDVNASYARARSMGGGHSEDPTMMRSRTAPIGYRSSDYDEEYQDSFYPTKDLILPHTVADKNEIDRNRTMSTVSSSEKDDDESQITFDSSFDHAPENASVGSRKSKSSSSRKSSRSQNGRSTINSIIQLISGDESSVSQRFCGVKVAFCGNSQTASAVSDETEESSLFDTPNGSQSVKNVPCFSGPIIKEYQKASEKEKVDPKQQVKDVFQGLTQDNRGLLHENRELLSDDKTTASNDSKTSQATSKELGAILKVLEEVHTYMFRGGRQDSTRLQSISAVLKKAEDRLKGATQTDSKAQKIPTISPSTEKTPSPKSIGEKLKELTSSIIKMAEQKMDEKMGFSDDDETALISILEDDATFAETLSVDETATLQDIILTNRTESWASKDDTNFAAFGYFREEGDAVTHNHQDIEIQQQPADRSRRHNLKILGVEDSDIYSSVFGGFEEQESAFQWSAASSSRLPFDERAETIHAPSRGVATQEDLDRMALIMPSANNGIDEPRFRQFEAESSSRMRSLISQIVHETNEDPNYGKKKFNVDDPRDAKTRTCLRAPSFRHKAKCRDEDPEILKEARKQQGVGTDVSGSSSLVTLRARNTILREASVLGRQASSPKKEHTVNNDIFDDLPVNVNVGEGGDIEVNDRRAFDNLPSWRVDKETARSKRCWSRGRKKKVSPSGVSKP